MKSYQDYLNIYREIAKNLNLRGDSVEMISQMLANATFISEVEHVAYSQEASLERATLMNSKIQHCMNEMYSVFRGSCPRVILRFQSNSYFQWNVFDEISSSNSFNLYYLGYYSGDNHISSDTGTTSISDYSEFTYAPISIPPTGESVEYTIIALLSPKMILGEWTLSKSNHYYVDLLESNLSNDIMVKVNESYIDVTRIFSEHIKKGIIFDLTLPDYGLRLYAPDIFKKTQILSNEVLETPVNTKISAQVFQYSSLSDYSSSELKNIKIKGTKLVSFPEGFLMNYSNELATGLIFLDEIPRDTQSTLHYKALRDRYVGSMIRSNSDIGVLLEETYPEKVRKSGTSFIFESLKTTRTEINEVTTNFNFVDSSDGSGLTYDKEEGVFPVTLPSGLSIYGSERGPITVFHNKSGKSPISYTPEFNSNISFNSAILLNSEGSFIDNKILGGVIRVPIKGKGRLRILHKNSYDIKTTAAYDIIPNCSAVFSVYKDFGSEFITKTIGLSVVKTSSGVSKILSGFSLLNENLKYYYRLDDSSIESEISGLELSLSNVSATDRIVLVLRDSSGSLLDEEIVPIVYSNSKKEINEVSQNNISKTITETITEKDSNGNEKVTSTVTNSSNIDYSGSYNFSGDYRLNLSNDLVFIESSESGEILSSFPIVVTSSLYSNGSIITEGVSYEVLKSSGVDCSISTSGVLTINSISNLEDSIVLLVRAHHNGISISAPLTIKMNLSLNAFKSRKLIVSDDPTGKTIIKSIESTTVGQLSEVEYSGGNNYLYLWLSGSPSIYIYSLEWIEDQETVVNIVNPENISPELAIYYIPYVSTTLLTDFEISSFIEDKKSYYITHDITINRGNVVNAIININLELFQNGSIDNYVEDILEDYSYKFNTDLEGSIPEIMSSISKITNVKRIMDLSISYKHELGYNLSWSDISSNLSKTYFVINYQINSTIA